MDNSNIINRGLCWESMGKIGKTFTIDFQVYAWLAEYAKKNNKKESAIVNDLLNSARRTNQTWKCPECNSVNDNQFTTCHSCPHVLVKA